MSYNESFVNLVSLIISKVYLITDEGFISFLKSDYVINLQELDISQTSLTDQSIYFLAKKECKVRYLKVLLMKECVDISENSIIQFINSENSFFINYLDFSELDLTNKIIENICNSKYMSNLKNLIVNGCSKISFQCF